MKNRKFTNQYTSKLSQVLTFLGYNIIVWIMMSSCNYSPSFDLSHVKENPTFVKETVLFLGNPGAGKSTLLNSLLGENRFQSGVSCGQGMTKFQQDFILNGVKYVDTPGLADAKIRDQAAKSIEEALKKNSKYKIVFVITVEAGRIRPDDLQTINAVCGAIKTEFSYGIILNKISKPALKKLEREFGPVEEIFEKFLHKQPTDYAVIFKHEDLEDEDNVYLPQNSEQVQVLKDFIARLETNQAGTPSTLKETVLFCGNSSTGKSSLLNSLLQENRFPSGVSVGQGMTKHQQDCIRHGIRYVDTPGLSDPKIRQQAAKSIEEALKQNGNYKIVFVITVEAARIRPDDLQTINSVCQSINTTFSYGIILNKVTKLALKKLEAEFGSLQQVFSKSLDKQPTDFTVILKHEDLEDEDDVYLPQNSEQMMVLKDFVARLTPNNISPTNVARLFANQYEEKLKQMQALIENQRREIYEMRRSYRIDIEGVQYGAEENINNCSLQ